VVPHRRGVEVGERAIRTAIELDDLQLRIMATDVVAQSYHELGQLPRAIELARSSVAVLSGDLTGELLGNYRLPSVMSRIVLGLCLAWQGNFDEAGEALEEGLAIAERANQPLTINFVCLVGGLVQALRGDTARGISLMERGHAISRSLGLALNASGQAFLGHGYDVAGQHEEAVAWIQDGLAAARATKFRPCTSLWTTWLADAQLHAGLVHEARETASLAVQMGRDHQERGFEGYALRQLGDVLVAGEPPDLAHAEDLYHQALAIAEDLGMRPLQAHTHLSLGKLYRRAGRAHGARAELDVAIDLYLSMEMRHWLPEAEAELAQVALP